MLLALAAALAHVVIIVAVTVHGLRAERRAAKPLPDAEAFEDWARTWKGH